MFGKKKKKQDPFEGWREEDDHATDLTPEDGYWYRGQKLTKEQYHELMDKGIIGLKEFNEQLGKDWGDRFREEVKHATSHEFAGTEWGLMDDETKQRIVRDAGVRGLVVPNEYAQPMASGSFYDPQYLHLSTGTNPQWAMHVEGGLKADRISVDSLDVDALWEKMYQRMRKVIVICKYCQTPNVIDNQTCTQCGAPLPVEFL